MQKIIDYFRKKYFQKKYNITDLVREELKGITLDFVNTNTIDNNLSEKDRRELYAKSALIKKDFTKIVDNLINIQGNFAVKEANNIEQLLFTRGTINGLILIKEEVDRLYALFLEQTEAKESFDKSDLI